ncbi:hypothetical protein, partial [Enterobacter asburiae]|uniref:hypothetical protein n=1 Tax=Enterobacter asburiae TaxID=61645 RepID=UPI001E429C8F
FLKNTLVTNQHNRTSPVGSVGMFLYSGEMATTAGASVSGAALKPACIIFKNKSIDPWVYSGGDPGGMPGTWRALGQVGLNCVCLFTRIM